MIWSGKNSTFTGPNVQWSPRYLWNDCYTQSGFWCFALLQPQDSHLRAIRAKKSPCGAWLHFLVGQKRSLTRLVILKSLPMSPAYFYQCHLWKYRHRVYWYLSHPLSILKVIFLKSNPFRFEETLNLSPSIEKVTQ